MPFNPPGGHRHDDNLALYLRDSGRTLLGDRGYVGDMPVNKWIKSAFSHNLVIVDDAGQVHGGEDPRTPALRMFATSPLVSVVEAESKVYPQCTEYRRLVALFKGPESRTFAVDVFRVKGGNKHDYRIFSELASSDAPEGALDFSGVEVPEQEPPRAVGNSLAKEDIYGLKDVRTGTDPPPSWQATWREDAGAYRLWMLTQADSVQTSHGPGQESRDTAGRRVRYVDTIRAGEDLSSCFVAVHEPGNRDGTFAIHSVERLEIPSAAGPEAAALKIESDGGTYIVLHDFSGEAEIEGIRFDGSFGVFCDETGEGRWIFGLGASTLQRDRFGFEGRTSHWKSEVSGSTEMALTAISPKPEDWPDVPKGCQNYILVHDGKYPTGFPVHEIGDRTVSVDRFPLPEVSEFELPGLWYLEERSGEWGNSTSVP